MQIFPLKLRSVLIEPREKSLPVFASPLLKKEEETSLERQMTAQPARSAARSVSVYPHEAQSRMPKPGESR